MCQQYCLKLQLQMKKKTLALVFLRILLQGFVCLFGFFLVLSMGMLKTAAVSSCNMIKVHFSHGLTEESVVKIWNSIAVCSVNSEMARLVIQTLFFSKILF